MIPPARPRWGGRLDPWLGGLLVAQAVLLASVKFARGAEAELWWLSHVSLGLAAAGLFLRSPLLVAAALTNVLALHALWMFDCAFGITTGTFPLAMTNRMAEADALTWAATAHHFYLAPVLIALLWRRRAYRMTAIVVCAGVFVLLSLACRFIVGPEANINASHVLLPGLGNPVTAAMNRLSTWPYLVALNAWAIVGMFFPAAVFLHRVAGPRPVAS